MKTFLFIILLEGICSIITATFASTYKCLVLQHTDGTQTAIGLYKEPRITFDAKSLIVHSPVLDMTFPKENILKYTFEERGGDTANETIATKELQITVSETQITVSGYTGQELVTLYDVSGKKLPIEVSRSEGMLQIPLSSLVSGIYILKVGDQSFKFRKL